MGPYNENQFNVNVAPTSSTSSGSSGGFGSMLMGALSNVAGLIPGVGGLISSGLNLFGQHLQNKHEVEMWNMNNEYNSPKAQMERMVAAGINPNLAAAGIAGTNQMASAPSAAQVQDLGAVGQGIAESVESAQSAALRDRDIAGKELDNIAKEIENQYLPSKARAIVDELIARKNESESRTKYNDEQAKIAKSFADHAEEFRTLELNKLNKEIEDYEHQWKKIEQDIKESESRIGVNGVQAQLLQAQTEFWNQKLQGLEPGSPQYALMVAARDHGVDSDEYKRVLDVINDVDYALKSAGQQAIVDTDPMTGETVQQFSRYDERISALDKEMSELEKSHNNFAKLKNRMGFAWQRYLNLKWQRDQLIKERNKLMPNRYNSSSTSVKAGPVSVSHSG